MKKIPVRDIKPPKKELDSPEIFSIRDLRQLLAGKDLTQELHRHNFFYGLALRKGRGNHEIDFVTYEVGDRSIFFMRPGQVHQLTLRKGSEGYLIAFKMDFYFPHDRSSGRLLRKVSGKNLYTPDAGSFKKLFSVLKYMFEEYSGKQESYQEIIKANLRILFLELLRYNKYDASETSGYAQERLEDFLDLLEASGSSRKLASQYAEMLNLSPYQLNAITRQTLGKTCSELIHEYNILESKRYLLATSNQVSQIADHLGYEDVSYFIRFFKKHTGYSPEAYRKNFR